MHTVIECRSAEQIRDDRLIKAHNDINSLLSAWRRGNWVYVGAQRESLIALKRLVEDAILGGEFPREIEARIAFALATH